MFLRLVLFFALLVLFVVVVVWSAFVPVGPCATALVVLGIGTMGI